MNKRINVAAIILLMVLSNNVFAQKKVITYNLSYESGWEIASDVDQVPGKVIVIPLVDSVKSFYLWTGENPVDLYLTDSALHPMELSVTYKAFGFVIKKFPVWIQMGYKDDKGEMIKSRRYRYSKRY